MNFQSHVPDFAAGTPPAIPNTYFKNFQELLQHPWIKGWNKGQLNFKYYWSSHWENWYTLVAMWDKPNGEKYWWVLGYMDEIPKELEKWKSPE